MGELAHSQLRAQGMGATPISHAHHHPVGAQAKSEEQGGVGSSRTAVSCTGSRAEVSADQVATVVWDYFNQLGSNAKEAVEHLQKSELTQQIK